MESDAFPCCSLLVRRHGDTQPHTVTLKCMRNNLVVKGGVCPFPRCMRQASSCTQRSLFSSSHSQELIQVLFLPLYRRHQEQLKIMFVGGPNTRKDYHIEEGEEVGCGCSPCHPAATPGGADTSIPGLERMAQRKANMTATGRKNGCLKIGVPAGIPFIALCSRNSTGEAL